MSVTEMQNIRITKETLSILKEIAEENLRTVPKTIEWLAKKYLASTKLELTQNDLRDEIRDRIESIENGTADLVSFDSAEDFSAWLKKESVE